MILTVAASPSPSFVSCLSVSINNMNNVTKNNPPYVKSDKKKRLLKVERSKKQALVLKSVVIFCLFLQYLLSGNTLDKI